ncbi:hypothetical protein [Maribellus maritimus]|uniref:hypothetical protein n=1 Tax=Maribellus maritimus TaxID=2870838 RepID=UPI001EECB5ED|nr:hypothetical protein [Maribellus maritimus]MCG6190479.1 hypothetical protein [Maribellus maritimus]
MDSWKHKITVPDGIKCKINGINVWDYEWVSTDKKIVVNDPLYHQEYTMEVYEIRTSKKIVKFATGEFSNGIWGFYTESKS